MFLFFGGQAGSKAADFGGDFEGAGDFGEGDFGWVAAGEGAQDVLGDGEEFFGGGPLALFEGLGALGPEGGDVALGGEVDLDAGAEELFVVSGHALFPLEFAGPAFGGAGGDADAAGDFGAGAVAADVEVAKEGLEGGVGFAGVGFEGEVGFDFIEFGHGRS